MTFPKTFLAVFLAILCAVGTLWVIYDIRHSAAERDNFARQTEELSRRAEVDAVLRRTPRELTPEEREEQRQRDIRARLYDNQQVERKARGENPYKSTGNERFWRQQQYDQSDQWKRNLRRPNRSVERHARVQVRFRARLTFQSG